MNGKIWLMGWVRSGNAMRPVGAVDPTMRRTRQEQDEPKLLTSSCLFGEVREIKSSPVTTAFPATNMDPEPAALERGRTLSWTHRNYPSQCHCRQNSGFWILEGRPSTASSPPDQSPQSHDTKSHSASQLFVECHFQSRQWFTDATISIIDHNRWFIVYYYYHSANG